MESHNNRAQEQQDVLGNIVRQLQEFSTIMSTQSDRISTLQAELITLKNPTERARLTYTPRREPQVRIDQIKINSYIYNDIFDNCDFN